MGTRVGREVHGEEQEKVGRAQPEGSWQVMRNFEFYALLVTRFSLRLWLVTRGGRYASTSVKAAYGVNHSAI